MIRHWFIAAVVALAIAGMGSVSQAAQRDQVTRQLDHTQWVAVVLEQMLTVKPGMTRGDMLKVVKGEGGLSSPWARTYVSRECPYFKIAVTFESFLGSSRDADGRLRFQEDDRDVITTVSNPFLQFSVMD